MLVCVLLRIVTFCGTYVRKWPALVITPTLVLSTLSTSGSLVVIRVAQSTMR